MQDHIQEPQSPSFISRLIGTKNGRLGLAGGLVMFALVWMFLGATAGLLLLLATSAGGFAAYKLNSKLKMTGTTDGAPDVEPAKRGGLSLPGLSKGKKKAAPTGPQPYDPQAFTPTPLPAQAPQPSAYTGTSHLAAMQQGHAPTPQAYTPTQHYGQPYGMPQEHMTQPHMPQTPMPQEHMSQTHMQNHYGQPPYPQQGYEQPPANPPVMPNPPVMQAEPEVYQHVSGQPPQPYVPPATPAATPAQAGPQDQSHAQPREFAPQLFIPTNPTAA